ncbi:MAG: ribonuclease [Sphingomicrobium sp.]
MPEWLIERGIGEDRAVLVEAGHIVEARIMREGVVPAGTILAAQLKSTGRNAVAVAGGAEYLLPSGAPGVTEGAALAIEVTRESLGGIEPWKRPLARLSLDPPRAALDLPGQPVAFPAPDDPLEAAGWSDLLDEARSGIIAFPGGALRVSLTPAMTLIDVDGQLEPEPLCLAGAGAAALAIRRHGIAGSIGIDLPSVRSKDNRVAAAAVIDAVLPQPFERTAVNGFGFVQIVRRRRHASTFELAVDRPSFEARALLRRASRAVGAVTLVAHPAVIAVLTARPSWLDCLARQIGGPVGLRADASLGMEAGDAVRA